MINELGHKDNNNDIAWLFKPFEYLEMELDLLLRLSNELLKPSFMDLGEDVKWIMSLK